jgi:hypothetical protein
MNGKTCGSCKFWCEQPLPSGAVEVRREKMGVCKERIHLIPSQIVPGPGGQMMIGCQAGYPMGVPSSFPACGQYAAILELGMERVEA